MQLGTPQLLTDSLAALHMLAGWGRWSVERMLRCVDRREVRWIVLLAAMAVVAPLVEKVKAHDDEARDRGYPKAVGNATADEAARYAATSEQVALFNIDLSPFGDPVLLVDAAGAEVADVRAALAELW
jgi:hypothetical protein